MRLASKVTRLLTYVSGSTFIFGIKSLYFISFLPIFLQFFTTSIRLRNWYVWTVPVSTEALDTKVMDVWGTKVCHGEYKFEGEKGDLDYDAWLLTANIGRIKTGSTVGMDALGSP